MKIELNRYGIRLIPEKIQDVAFLEDTLGMKNEGDSITLIRENKSVRYNIKPSWEFSLVYSKSDPDFGFSEEVRKSDGFEEI